MDDIRFMMDYDEVSVYFTKSHFLRTEGPPPGLDVTCQGWDMLPRGPQFNL